MPVTVTKIEDIGRLKIVSAQFAGQPIAIVTSKDAEIPAEPALPSNFSGRHIRRSWRLGRGGLSHGQDLEQQGLVSGAAGAGAGSILGRHTADDRGHYSLQDTFGKISSLARHDWLQATARLSPFLGLGCPQSGILCDSSW